MKAWQKYPALILGGVLAVADAVAVGVLDVPSPWGAVALGASIFLGGLGIHTQVSPAAYRRGKVK